MHTHSIDSTVHKSTNTPTSNKPTVGIIVPNLNDQYAALIWDGITDTLKNSGVNTITVEATFYTQDMVPSVFELIRDHLTNPAVLDYVIAHTGLLSGRFGYGPTVAWLRSLNQSLPVVNIAVPVDNMPTILVDNYSGMRELVEHLIVAHDRQNFALIIGKDEEHTESEDRYRAMVDAIEAHGMKVNESFVYKCQLWGNGGQEAVEYFYDKRNATHIDAIVCANDLTAHAVIRELHARDICVPEDVAVTGFDDVIDSRHMKPTLTTVNLSMYSHGVVAAQTTLSQIAGQTVAPTNYLPMVLKKRSSCGCTGDDLDTDDDQEYNPWVVKMAQAWPRINGSGRRLMYISNVAQLAETLEILSHEIGFEFCYIFEHIEMPATERAQLFCGYDRDGILLPTEFPDVFDCDNVIPQCLWTKHPNFHLVVDMLHVDSDVFGYMVMDLNTAEGWIHQSLRAQIASAIKTIKLLEKEKQYASQLEQQVAKRTSELEALLHERASWLRIAAHDLLNPLSAIKLNASLIGKQKDQLGAEKLDQRVQRITNSVDHMNSIIGRFLAVDGVDADRIAIERHYVNFADILRELVDTQRVIAEAKEIEIQTDIDTNASGEVDADLLSQVCTNLLTNAIKYSPPQTTITVCLHRIDDQLHLIVQDQGPGFTDEDKANLYSPFTLLSARPTGGEESTGLGLFIVHKLVHAMDGSIQLESDGCNSGSKFTVLVSAA